MNNVPLKSDPRAAEWLMEAIDVCKGPRSDRGHARLFFQRRT